MPPGSSDFNSRTIAIATSQPRPAPTALRINDSVEALANQVLAGGAERGTDGALANASRCTCEEEVGHVHAGNDQQQTDGTKEDPERASQFVAGDPCAARLHDVGQALVGGIACLELGPDAAKIVPRGLDRHAVLQPADPDVLPAATVRIRPPEEGHENVGGIEPGTARRQHANDFVRPAIEGYGPADKARIGAEPACPEAVRQERARRRSARIILAGREEPAGDGLRAQAAKETDADRGARNTLWQIEAGEGEARATVEAELLERPVHVADVPAIAIRN